MERHVYSVALLFLFLIFTHVNFIAAPPALTVPPALPASQTVDQGQVAYVSVATPTGGSTPYTYQWFEESPGAGTFALANDCALQTTLACTFSTGTGTATGTYLFLLQVTDKKGTIVNSSTATVNVNTALSVPTPSASNHTIDQGQLSTLSSTSPTTGTPPYGYQWFLEGPANSSFSVIPGATSSSYAFTTSGGNPCWDIRV